MSNLTELLPAGGSGKTADFTASGTLPNGSKVVLNGDGTVTAVGTSSSPVTESWGSETNFHAAGTEYATVVFDSANGKVVIAYKDTANLNYGTAVVGTVSGTTISFGSEVIFESTSTTNIGAGYDTINGKVVLAYDKGNTQGMAVVGTVSGTSITFGSSSLFNSGYNEKCAVTYDSASGNMAISYRNGTAGYTIIGTVSGAAISFGSAVSFAANTNQFSTDFDSSNNKLVVAFRDSNNSNYGTAVVGTISGTTISFGSNVVFNAGAMEYPRIVFDSNANKVVIAYRDNANSNYGTGIVGTVSGTSITFGSEYVFESAAINYNSGTFDSNINKVSITYTTAWNNYYGKSVTATVSGTALSFSTPYTFNLAHSYYNTTTFDSVNNKVVIAYRDGGNADYGTCVVYQPGGNQIATNLTDTNFLGTSTEAYSDSDTATILLQGGISTNQSSLTTGSDYYVQADGTLSTTADSPSVKLGKALSSTTVLLSGE